MFADVYERIKRKNKILFSTDSACIAPLLTYLAPLSRRIAAMFALDCAEKPSQKLRMLTGEPLAEQTIEVCRAWAAGDVKMNAAHRAILALHARAKTLGAAEGALCHAVAQACSTVHVKEHARGLIFYELTVIVRECQSAGEPFEEKVFARIEEYLAALDKWSKADLTAYRWAAFLKA